MPDVVYSNHFFSHEPIHNNVHKSMKRLILFISLILTINMSFPINHEFPSHKLISILILIGQNECTIESLAIGRFQYWGNRTNQSRHSWIGLPLQLAGRRGKFSFILISTEFHLPKAIIWFKWCVCMISIDHRFWNLPLQRFVRLTYRRSDQDDH